MYSKEKQLHLADLTNKFLVNNPSKIRQIEELSKTIEQLKEVIRFHDYRYYILSDNLISDEEYDQLFSQLKAIEFKFPELITADSPTQRIASDLTKDFPQAAHLSPMLSLDNSYNSSDLLDWDKRIRDITRLDTIEYCVEPKFDGASIGLVYQDGFFTRAVTRGDGVKGDEVTNNIKVLPTIPLKTEFGVKLMELRGEVLINKDQFNKINELRMEEGSQILANPRNAAAGALRMQNASMVAKRGLEVFIYHIGFAEDDKNNNLLQNKFHTHFNNLKWLSELGYKTPVNEAKICKGINEVIDICNVWESKRDSYKYEIDGMVIKVNELQLQETIGSTSHHPRWAMAFKFKSKQAITKLENVEFQIGRTGVLTPVAKVKEVFIAGVNVSSISLFNEDFVKSKDIKIGDHIVVERSGDVIPYVSKVITEDRSGEEIPIKFPKVCPSCSDQLVKIEEEVAWRCININCPEQTVERIIHFVSKSAMNIDGFGKAIVKRLYEAKLLFSITDIYQLNYGKILELDGFRERSVEKLANSINNSKQQSMNRLIFGLGIRFVGEITAKTLASHIQSVEELEKWSEEQLMGLDDIGPKVAKSIVDFFSKPANRNLIYKLKQLGVDTCKKDKKKGDKLAGMTFLFTGTLQHLKREEAKAAVEQQGGKVVSVVSSQLNFLVVGDSPGSKLQKAKKIGSVEILNELEFTQMIE